MTEPQSIAPSAKRRRRWFLYGLLAVLVVSVAVLIVCLHPVYSVVWDGRFELPLNPPSPSGKRIQSVLYQTASSRKEAEWMAQNPKSGEVLCGFREAEKETGEFVAAIGCSGRSNAWNVDTSYYQPPFLVVGMKYENGDEEYKAVEIPMERGVRHSPLQLP